MHFFVEVWWRESVKGDGYTIYVDIRRIYIYIYSMYTYLYILYVYRSHFFWTVQKNPLGTTVFFQ